jgi:hypothetical protein
MNQKKVVKKKRKRNYAKENKWENSPEQVKRRVDRNRARRHAIKKGLVRKGDGKEIDHKGTHPHGSLRNVPTRVVSRHKNRVRQPPHKGSRN